MGFPSIICTKALAKGSILCRLLVVYIISSSGRLEVPETSPTSLEAIELATELMEAGMGRGKETHRVHGSSRSIDSHVQSVARKFGRRCLVVLCTSIRDCVYVCGGRRQVSSSIYSISRWSDVLCNCRENGLVSMASGTSCRAENVEEEGASEKEAAEESGSDWLTTV